MAWRGRCRGNDDRTHARIKSLREGCGGHEEDGLVRVALRGLFKRGVTVSHPFTCRRSEEAVAQ